MRRGIGYILIVLSLFFLAYAALTGWFFRDGLGPDSITSTGAEALLRFFQEGFGSALIISIIISCIGCWMIKSAPHNKMKTEADYTLPERFIKSVAGMDEIRPGGSILSVKLKDGDVISGLCVSTCKWFIGHATLKDIPFDIVDIEEVFQSQQDKDTRTPKSGWTWWDTGCRAANLR